MKHISIAMHAFIVASFAFVVCASHTMPDQCPSVCPGATTTTIVGTPPCAPHATFFFDFIGGPNPGVGSADCERTCLPCTQQVHLMWNSNGQPCCLQVDTGDAGGLSAPVPKFNRTGNLIANCDEARVYSVVLLPDCEVNSQWAYTKSLTLYCGCAN
jgi:hypothetical protein